MSGQSEASSCSEFAVCKLFLQAAVLYWSQNKALLLCIYVKVCAQLQTKILCF
jgi:hypothetical protein